MIAWLQQRKKWIIVVCSLLALGGVGGVLFFKGPLGPTKVTVAQVRQEDIKPSVFGIGTVEARLSYNIGPTQAGRVLNVFADQGEKVQAGQILGEIDPVDLEQRLLSASAAVSRAQSSAAVVDAQIRDLTHRSVLAQTNAKRYSELFAAQAISREVVDAKQNEANAAQAALDAAYASLMAARDEISRTVSERDALVRQRNNLRLVSPANGIIVSREAEPGTTVVAGQSVFRIIDPQTLWVKTRIDQSRYYGIAVGQQASIALRSRPDAPIAGKVARLEAQGDSVTEERFVSVIFDNISGILPLGELAEVTIMLQPVSKALVVPSTAVKRANRLDGVWLVDDGKLKFQPVTIGAQTLDGKTQIVNGLKLGDQVAAYSSKQLTSGMRVRVEEIHD